MKQILCIGMLLVAACDAPPEEDPGAPMTPPTDPGACKTQAARLWKLTPAQLGRTVEALVPGAGKLADPLAATLSRTDGVFDNGAEGLEMTTPHVDQLLDLGRAITDPLQKAPEKLRACLSAAAPDRDCVRAFIEDYGSRGLRRPLRADEVDTYLDEYYARRTEFGNRAALAMYLRNLLLSPELLYRTELGPDDGAPPDVEAVVEMTPHEKAQALSYLILDGPPDAELRAAADKGELASGAQVAAQARRLLARPETAPGIEKIFSQLLRLAEVPIMRKTKASFPTYSALVGLDMAEETRRFVRHVLWQDGGKLPTLLTANYSIINRRLADYYGVQSPSEDFARVEFPPGRRMGVLTHGGLMGLLGNEIETSPVMRGKFVRERFLCQPIPPPPPNVNAIPPRADGVKTQRERLAQHSADSTCQNCHRLMDPIGLALESFDGAGLFRETENGKTLDTSGKLVGLRSGERAFANTAELVRVLGEEKQVADCFTQNAFQYAVGRPAQACEQERLGARFAETGGDVLDLIVTAVGADGAFQRRRGGKEQP